jgi:DNA-binding NtrC family response regulator
MLDAVLFVDDDDDLREVMRDTLGRLGVRQIITAGSLREVEEHRDEALQCQLAVLDINLGSDEPNGVSVFEWLEHEGFAGRVVFLSGHGNKDVRVQQAASCAGSRVASKPITLAKLRDLIGDASPGP